MCGACEMECSVDAIRTEIKGYKVVVGGTGSRHPQLAATVAECSDLEAVIKILEKAINLFKETPVGEKEISFHELIKRYGTTALSI